MTDDTDGAHVVVEQADQTFLWLLRRNQVRQVLSYSTPKITINCDPSLADAALNF
jgi:hypothetical protein